MSRPSLGALHPLQISTRTIGAAWIAISAQILESGNEGSYDGLAMREIILPTLIVSEPCSADDLIDLYADRDRLAWMHANFTDHRRVQELDDAASYATRLRDYADTGRDQLQWVVEKLQADKSTRSATITTLQPLSDTSYIPCISLLDFFFLDDSLELAVYAHSIDFGAKGYANLVELAYLQEEVTEQLGAALGRLTMIVKSAHIYATEFEYMHGVVLAQRVQTYIE